MNYVKRFVFDFWFILPAFLATIFMWSHPFTLIAILLAFSVLVFIQSGNLKRDLIVFIVAGFVSFILESISVNAGIWTYALPQLAGIPFWLFFVWGLASIAIVKFSEFISDIRGKQ